jgi:hypothetical protein
MSATKKQLAANRRNAQKSTGPKTADGKAASSQSHLKHGLYSGNIIVSAPRKKLSNPTKRTHNGIRMIYCIFLRLLAITCR